MPVVKTHKRWWLGPNDYLDVVRNNTDREVIFTLGYREKDSRVTERASWTMNLAEGTLREVGKTEKARILGSSPLTGIVFHRTLADWLNSLVELENLVRQMSKS